MAKAKKGPVQYQPSHYAPIPMVDWDAPEADRLIAQRDVLHLAKLNMMVAIEAFDLAWQLHEDVERQIAPHPFQSNTPTTGPKDAYMPPDCRRCFKKRCDPRHGAVPRHPFVPCERSWRSEIATADQLCFECGLKQFAPEHTSR